jgi:hypothetical protein
LTSFLNGKTIGKKVVPLGVLIEEGDDIIVTRTLSMQKCGLSITLQHLKWKVVKPIQTLPDPFQNGLLSKFMVLLL